MGFHKSVSHNQSIAWVRCESLLIPSEDGPPQPGLNPGSNNSGSSPEGEGGNNNNNPKTQVQNPDSVGTRVRTQVTQVRTQVPGLTRFEPRFQPTNLGSGPGFKFGFRTWIQTWVLNLGSNLDFKPGFALKTFKKHPLPPPFLFRLTTFSKKA